MAKIFVILAAVFFLPSFYGNLSERCLKQTEFTTNYTRQNEILIRHSIHRVCLSSLRCVCILLQIRFHLFSFPVCSRQGGGFHVLFLHCLFRFYFSFFVMQTWKNFNARPSPETKVAKYNQHQHFIKCLQCMVCEFVSVCLINFTKMISLKKVLMRMVTPIVLHNRMRMTVITYDDAAIGTVNVNYLLY